MSELRFAVFGAGFWARYQLAAWQALRGARCVAICDPERERASTLARLFSIENVYTSPDAVYAQTQCDFVDIIAAPAAHVPLVREALQRRVPVICQKPLAETVGAARALRDLSSQTSTPLLVHENWRWQTPIRAVHRILESGEIGQVFRARVEFITNFPVFDNQPALKQHERFILADLGTHMLDSIRFLFGECSSLACHTTRVRQDIRGEDVATVLLRMRSGATVICAMSYASRVERDRFPETLLFIEGTAGSIELGPDYWVRTTTSTNTRTERFPPPRYSWASPAYDLVHASLVDCQANLLGALRGDTVAETTVVDNCNTLELVSAAYESAATGRTIDLE